MTESDRANRRAREARDGDDAPTGKRLVEGRASSQPSARAPVARDAALPRVALNVAPNEQHLATRARWVPTPDRTDQLASITVKRECRSAAAFQSEPDFLH